MMKREEAEKMIGSCLEIIRLICLEYKPDFEICSMYVTNNSTSAWIINNDKYDMKYDWKEDEKNVADA